MTTRLIGICGSVNCPSLLMHQIKLQRARVTHGLTRGELAPVPSVLSGVG
jgi:hypothetical protein